jgi:glycosyltransferase involved in cell wall biosynthesis
VVSQYYEPAFAGGTAVDARGAVAAAAAVADTWVLAGDRERDGMVCTAATPDRWVDHPSPLDQGTASVRYLDLGPLPLRAVRRAVVEVDPDVVVLFSMWAPGSMATLVLRRLRALGRRRPRVVVAPAGELAPGALAKERRKKEIVGRVGGLLRLWKGVTWRATDDDERHEIEARFPGAAVMAAPLLPAPPLVTPARAPARASGPVRLVSVATVASNKGLHHLLDRLADAARCGIQVVLRSFGSEVDPDYLRRCREKAAALPPGATASINGRADRATVAAELAAADAFALATAGENYGVAILEALDAGCPVLISDRTPWRGLAADGCGWDLPLDEPEPWIDALRELAGADDATRARWSAAARARAHAAREEAATEGATAWRDLLGLGTAGAAPSGGG